jgi:anti-sigma B factor antagonist
VWSDVPILRDVADRAPNPGSCSARTLGASMTVTIPAPLIDLTEASIGLDASQRNGVLRLRLFGDLDSASSPVLSRQLALICLDGWRAVLIDATSLTFLDSAGLRVFIATERRIEAAGGLLAIARSREPTRKVFALLGHERLLGRERIAIAIAYSEDGHELTWSPFGPGLGDARSA